MKNRNYTLILIIAMLFASAFSFAQRKKSSSSSPATTKTTGMKKHEGYFNYYYDAKRDKIFLLIDKLDQEFLYVNSLTAGIGSNDIGLDRGQLGGRKVVKFNRVGPKVLLIQPNYSYRAESDNPDEKRSVEQAFAQSVIWGFKVDMEDTDGILVDATDFLCVMRIM